MGALSDFIAKPGLIQIVNSQTGATATGTTQIPDDDTIPQSTEGDQYLSLSITPTSPTSVLVVDITLIVEASNSNRVTIALFSSPTVNALAAAVTQVSQNAPLTVSFKHKMVAGTTSPMTFNVRAGVSFSGTTRINGFSGSRLYGGVAASSITIMEVSA